MKKTAFCRLCDIVVNMEHKLCIINGFRACVRFACVRRWPIFNLCPFYAQFSTLEPATF